MSYISQELITSKNGIINKNLSKIKKKIAFLKSDIEEQDEEDIYDQIYCKINIYFTALINKIRLKYIQAIGYYKSKIKQYENDIIKLIMENMLLKIENNFLKENKNKNNIKENIYNSTNIISTKNQNKKINNIKNNNIFKFKKQFYKSQDNINIIKNKSVDFFIKYNGKNNFKKNNSSTNDKFKKKKINNRFEINQSNKSSNSNINVLNKNKKNINFSQISFLPLSCKKNQKTFILDEMEQNIIRHKTTQSQSNIRKIKDEMESIINKDKKNYKNINHINNDKNIYNTKINIINEDSVELSEKYSSDENSKYKFNNNKLKNINNINNNLSNNIIHNTSINIFNSSKGLYSLNNNINYNNSKHEIKHPIKMKKIVKNKIYNNNNIGTSLKNIYDNLQNKKRVYNNIKLNNKKFIKTEENNEKKKKSFNIKKNLFKNNSKEKNEKNIIINDNKDYYAFKYLNLPVNINNNINSRNIGNSLYNNSTSKINNYSYFNSENSKEEIEDNINYHKKNESGICTTLNNNLISIKRKNNFIQRNKSFNCLLKLKKILDNDYSKNNKKGIKLYNNINNNYATYSNIYKNN